VRQHDSIAVGVGHASLIGSQPTGKRTELTNVEVFYIAQLTPWLSLQPDIQYFDNPAVDESNGWALGLRWLFTF
jgi:carbohydrate-selective porin OprB